MGNNSIKKFEQERLTTEADWLQSYDQQELSDQDNHSIAILLQQFAGNGEGKTAIEIGSYPGSFLPTLGRLGYTLNGIDFNPNNVTVLPAWLKSKGCRVGQFITDDFFNFSQQSTQQYDLVCSFGFIEHFKNFDEVIHYHTKLVAPGGKLIITTPNFRGLLQYIPRRIFDNENLKKHHLPSMQPLHWKNQLLQLGFEVEHTGFNGGYTFWVDKSIDRSWLSKKLLRATELSIYQFKKLFVKIRWESAVFSSNCVIVAKKPL
jgi:2-polyprenyl-3-methyl-5-hydroxy-6-metoxy-1,4-benzoquinol methylase